MKKNYHSLIVLICASAIAGCSPAQPETHPEAHPETEVPQRASPPASAAQSANSITAAPKPGHSPVAPAKPTPSSPAPTPAPTPMGPIDALTVSGRLEGTPTLLKSQDESGGMILALNATIASAAFTPNPHEDLHLALASSRTFISPDLKGCVLTDDSFSTLGAGSQTLTLGARDASGATACLDFMTAVQQHGFTVHYIDVPLMNGDGSVKSVIVNLNVPTRP